MRTGRLPLGNFDEKTSISSREKLREERPHGKIFPSRRRPLFSAARESRDALKPSAAISGLRNFPVAKTLGTSRSRAFASDKKRDRGRASGEKKAIAAKTGAREKRSHPRQASVNLRHLVFRFSLRSPPSKVRGATSAAWRTWAAFADSCAFKSASASFDICSSLTASWRRSSEEISSCGCSFTPLQSAFRFPFSRPDSSESLPRIA